MKKNEKKSGGRRSLRNEQLAWDKLDNTANLFPVIATEEMTNVYRISVTLTEEIDRVLLQEALNRILPQFSVFRMRLRMGMFWYYFEENTRPAPIVREEYSYPGAYIDKSRNNHYMFRVTYYRCRINLEVFHALTDGAGGITFLKELVYQYLRLKYPDILKEDKDKISSGIFLDKEDSYIKNFKKGNAKHGKAYKSSKAVTLHGEMLPKGEMGVVHGYFPVEQLKAVSKKYGVTINQYLVGVFVYSIYREYLQQQPSKVPISCCVPVNLRPYYDSHTMKNFFAMVSADFRPEKEQYSFEEVLKIVSASLKEQITAENLNQIMSYNVSNEKNWILRVVPLVIKNFFIKRVYGASAGATSATVTNIGNIELKEMYRQYVEHFYVTLSMSKGQNMKGGICSYNGILTFTFSSVLVDLSIQKCFFQTIAKDGVSVAIESNGAYDE
ncbi:MAG: hypothetical protein NC300_08065 [Bacteroidales bacterium]|nr:hypothetical protein [Clostridium sp.]MCM1204085.1 hypothetical protein [Bacteroidales bacterium]